MLLAFPQHYKEPLPVDACNVFSHQCINLPDAAAGTKAVLSLLGGMQSPLPNPNLHTYSAVADCLVGQLQHCVPAYHLVAQLHDHVLPKMHQQLGTGMHTSEVYIILMRAFNRAASTSHVQTQASTIQLVLLMA